MWREPTSPLRVVRAVTGNGGRGGVSPPALSGLLGERSGGIWMRREPISTLRAVRSKKGGRIKLRERKRDNLPSY